MSNGMVHYEPGRLDGVDYIIEENVPRDGARYFEVYEVDPHRRTPGQQVQYGRWLTEYERFDERPTEDEIRALLPQKGTHHFVVRVSDCTELQAQRVMAERINVPEDYGFAYTIASEGPFEDVPSGNPSGGR